MKTTSINPEFGEQLKYLREMKGLTVRELAARANTALAVVTMVENGHWGAGPDLLIRLGEALGLKGRKLDAFILDGFSTSKRDLLLPKAKAYPARINNALALKCVECVLHPENISTCILNPKIAKSTLRSLARQLADIARAWKKAADSRNGEPITMGPDLGLQLRDGREVYMGLMLLNP